MGTAGCPRCGGVVALHEGRPFVTTNGSIELWHPACWDERDFAIIVDAPPVELTASRPRWRPSRGFNSAVAAAVATIAIGGAGVAWRRASATPVTATGLVSVTESALRSRDPHATREVVPPPSTYVETPLELKYAVPRISDRRLDTLYPSLDGWIHPVTGGPEIIPATGGRRFGAVRYGVERAECGSGHCGVDLDGPRGRPVVAVAAGVVVRVEHSEEGRDGKSGRYVRIQHDDGTLTAYMHLDEIAPGIEVRDRVDAGQYVGTLGSTAVHHSAPHLHFSLEIPNKLGSRGDITDTHYVDPAPFLVRATVAPVPDRRHARKPAS
ncbi:MAG: M23 family metallopeptidase [Kofleriaceae bacterium]